MFQFEYKIPTVNSEVLVHLKNIESPVVIWRKNVNCMLHVLEST